MESQRNAKPVHFTTIGQIVIKAVPLSVKRLFIYRCAKSDFNRISEALLEEYNPLENVWMNRSQLH